jgi:hypothetical protein
MLDAVNVLGHVGNMINDPFAAAGSVNQADKNFFNFLDLKVNEEHQFMETCIDYF